MNALLLHTPCGRSHAGPASPRQLTLEIGGASNVGREPSIAPLLERRGLATPPPAKEE